eukprot:1189900-Pyramimonas_sp.AAC.1
MDSTKPAAGGVNMLLSASFCTCLVCCLPCHTLTPRYHPAAILYSSEKRSAPALGRRTSSVVGRPDLLPSYTWVQLLNGSLTVSSMSHPVSSTSEQSQHETLIPLTSYPDCQRKD